jgi:hypothetical protein
MTLAQQRCLHHPSREAVARCPQCRHTFCRECVTEHDDRVLCAGCLSRQAAAPEGAGSGASLLRVVQLFAGLIVAWLFFFWLGQALLAIPSSFHDGTVWSDGLMEQL